MPVRQHEQLGLEALQQLAVHAIDRAGVHVQEHRLRPTTLNPRLHAATTTTTTSSSRHNAFTDSSASSAPTNLEQILVERVADTPKGDGRRVQRHAAALADLGRKQAVLWRHFVQLVDDGHSLPFHHSAATIMRSLTHSAQIRRFNHCHRTLPFARTLTPPRRAIGTETPAETCPPPPAASSGTRTDTSSHGNVSFATRDTSNTTYRTTPLHVRRLASLQINLAHRHSGRRAEHRHHAEATHNTVATLWRLQLRHTQRPQQHSATHRSVSSFALFSSASF